jgi:hypothetical protein
VTTVHNAVKETIRTHLTLVHVFHAYATVNTPWVAHALSHFTPVRYGRIASNSEGHHGSQRYTKLLSLRDLIKSRMCQYTTQTCSLGPDDQSLTDTGGGYHLGALNFRSYHSPSFPSSILHFSLIAMSSLQLCQSFNHLAKLHRTSIDRKGSYCERISITRLLLIAYTTKHSILSLYFFHRGKQSGLVSVFLVQLGFH